MTKRIFFMLGVSAGFLIAKILYRKALVRLDELEQKEAEDKAYYAELNRRWEEEVATWPFEKRMDWVLFEASLKLDNYQPDWDDDDEYDDEDDDI